MRKFATKIVSRQNSVLGVLVGVLGVLFGVPGVLVGILGVWWFVWRTLLFFGVIGVCGIGMLYLLHLEFGMVHLIVSSQNMCRFVFLFSE